VLVQVCWVSLFVHKEYLEFFKYFKLKGLAANEGPTAEGIWKKSLKSMTTWRKCVNLPTKEFAEISGCLHFRCKVPM
jgi:hypothetical protein